ncbi:alpha/beta fold hydrolase [Roseovarius nitratireducens]|uniref:alpha/beta fold hydrolase n=1 Tax=Roseovarius nitratireducens TaxID=2044597 RepID=UPI000CE236C2|nr:alpha/beta fold hydrolase [Roseovarius nitratireducens]
MTTDYTHKYLQVEGHRIAYLDEGTGPPVLLIHGIPTSSLLWRNIIPVLARTHRVIAPDMLNYGQSDKPEHTDVSIAAQARLMVGVLDSLGLARTDVVSHDIGGGVAQIIAVRYPERVKKLVLSSAVCFDSWPIPEFLPLQEPGAEAAMSLLDFLDMLRGFLPQGVHRPEALTSEVMEIIMAPWSSEEGKQAIFRNFRRLNPEYTQAIAGELTQLEHETLILWGQHDAFQKPAFAERLQETIPNAKLSWIDAAHWIMEEKPDEVGTVIADFLNAHTA